MGAVTVNRGMAMQHGKKYPPKRGSGGGKREYGQPGKTADGHDAYGPQKPIMRISLKKREPA